MHEMKCRSGVNNNLCHQDGGMDKVMKLSKAIMARLV